MGETIHRFVKGMDRDTHKIYRDPNSYYDAVNFYLTEGGDLKVYRQDTMASVDIDNQALKVGYCVVRNYLVIFVKNNQLGVSYIYKCVLNDDDTIGTVTEIYNDSETEDGSILNLASHIKAVGRYESEDIIKVYWCDENPDNTVKYINIAINNTTDGLVKSVSNDYVAVNRLEPIPYISLGEDIGVELVNGGTLKSGLVQYTYQYYTKHGAETVYVPFTNLLPLTEANEKGSYYKFKGSIPEADANKSVKLIITKSTDNDFDYIKVVRLHYASFGSLPTAAIVSESYVKDLTTISILDTGTSVSSLTSEDVSILGKMLFSAKDLAIKDERLFAANINDTYYDVDFDARAFRFPSRYRRNPSTEIFIRHGSTDYSYNLDADTTAGWAAIMSNNEAQIATKITPKHDCINLFNDHTYDNKTTYPDYKYDAAYQYDSNTLGGSGPNIKYELVEKDFVLDSSVFTSGAPTNSNIDSSPNYSYENYTSPYMCYSYKGYMRDETYRFGIVFFDKRGRESSVKWIGDVRFPDRSASPITDFTTEIGSSAYGIKFYVRNLPTDAVSFAIVRVNRSSSDKSIVSQGIISYAQYNAATSQYASPILPTCYVGVIGNYTLTSELLRYVCPEISYGTFDYNVGDYFKIISSFTALDQTYATGNRYTSYYATIRYHTETSPALVGSIFTPKELYTISPAVPLAEQTFGDLTIPAAPYKHRSLYGVGSPERHGIGGTSVLFTHDESFAGTLGGPTTDYVYIVNQVRNNNAQYGGNTYDARKLNQYISCGTIVTEDDYGFNRNATYDAYSTTVYGGDTYISMYENLWATYIEDYYGHTGAGTEGEYEACRIVYFPVESTYNCGYDSGFKHSRNYNENNIWLVRENAGDHAGYDPTDTLKVLYQTDDFYIYNSVYSYNDVVKKYFAQNDDVEHITGFDTRVVYSDNKINNESIDSWTIFRTSNFKDVDSTYGSVNNLINFRDRLFYWQDHGFGMLSVNERAVVTDENNPGAIVLGTGGILDRYTYVSTTKGNVNSEGIILGEKGIYWVDNFTPSIMFYNGELFELDREKKVNTVMKGIADNISNVIGGFDRRYNHVHFYFDCIPDNVLVYGETQGCFFGWQTYVPIKYIQLYKKFITVRQSGNNRLFYNQGDSSATYQTASLTVLSIGNSLVTKVWDNLSWVTTSKNITLPGVDFFNNTFGTLKVYNDYQNSDEIDLVKDINLYRRERLWTTTIPRNSVGINVSSNPDITDITNLTATTYKERMRDDHLYLKLDYDTTNNYSSGYDFSVSFINVKFRESAR